MATSALEPTTSEATLPELLVMYLKRPVVLLTGLAIVTFLLYVSTLSFDFVWDDHSQVESNPLVLSWKAVPRAFHSNLWYQMTPQGRGNYYRPFFLVWSVFNHSIFGLHPWGWHATNLLLQITASLLIFILLRRLGVEYWCAAIAALIFSCHPVHIEPVAWISAGADILVTVLYLLTFLCFLQSQGSEYQKRIAWLAASCLSFSCALLTKEMALTFPVVLFIYSLLFRSTDRAIIARLARALATVSPYIVLNLLYLALRVRVLHTLSQTQTNYGFLPTLLTLPVVLMTYLRLLILPTGLTGFYYTPLLHTFSFSRFIIPAVGLMLVVALVWWWFKQERDPLIVFFALWIPVCLIPALYLPSFREGDFVRDRYVFLSSVGFVFLLAKAIRRIPVHVLGQARPWLQPAAVAILFVSFSWGVFAQQVYWANDLLVFDRGYSLYPQNVTAAQNLGAKLYRIGDSPSAMRVLQQALRDDPNDPYSHWVLALVQSDLNHEEQATQELATAIRLAPEYFLQTADGLTDVGVAYATAHQYDQAEASLKRALQIEPEASAPLLDLGLVLLRKHRPDEAEIYIKRAAAVNPEAYNVNWALGMAAQMRGDRTLAQRAFSDELRFHPENKTARLSLTAVTQ